MRHRTLAKFAMGIGLLAALPSTTALGGSILKFRLSNQGTQSIARIDFNVVPPGAVIPPVAGTDPTTGQPTTGSPLTILTGTSGFDATLLSVALGSKPGTQALRLLFGQTQTVDDKGEVTFAPIVGLDGRPKGQFDPGSVLEFSLNVDSEKVSLFDLILPDMAAGLVLQDLPSDTLAGGEPVSPTQPAPESPTPVNQIPEPGPLAVWGLVSGWALWRAGRARIRRAA